MKLKTAKLSFLLSAIAALGVYSPYEASAATLTWDPAANGVGSNGTGNWDNATSNWATGSGDTTILPFAQAPLTAAHTSGTNTITVSAANSLLLQVGQALSTTAFAAGTTISAINTTTGVVTLSANSTAGIGNGTAIGFAPNDSVIFGTGSGMAGTVTVSGNQGANAMTINAASGGGNYSFTGGSITLGSNNGATGTLTVNSSASIASAFNVKNITFGVLGQTLTLSGGSTANSVVGAFGGTVGMSGTSTAIAASSTVAVTGGAYTSVGSGNPINIGNQATETGGFQMSGGTFTTGGSFQVGNSGSGFANLTGGTIASSGQVSIGRGSVTNLGKLNINGGTINSTGVSGTDTQVQIGRSNGVGTLNVQSGTLSVIGNGIAGNSGGVLVINSNNNGTAGSGTVNISGGTVTVKDLRLNGGNNLTGGTNSTSASSAGSATLNVTGGSLYIGGTVLNGVNGTVGGLNNYNIGTATYAINLSGGTVGANANWSSSLNMTLGTTNGDVTFKAANVSNAAFNISLSGALSGAGGLVKSGGGVLTLTGANTYTGGTTVTAGTLSINTAYLADGGNVYLTTGSVFNLNFVGNDTINALFLDGIVQPIGVYGASGLGSSFFTGTGFLNVTAIPEPSVWGGLLGVGLGALVVLRRRRSRA